VTLSRFRRTAILGALAVAVLVAGITLAVSGTSDSSEPETAADARSRFVVAGDLTLTLARGWAPGGDEAALQRLGLDDGAAFAPAGGDGSAGLLIGQDRSPPPDSSPSRSPSSSAPPVRRPRRWSASPRGRGAPRQPRGR
jgi:hypothetical protein